MWDLRCGRVWNTTVVNIRHSTGGGVNEKSNITIMERSFVRKQVLRTENMGKPHVHKISKHKYEKERYLRRVLSSRARLTSHFGFGLFFFLHSRSRGTPTSAISFASGSGKLTPRYLVIA
jgi:hypothetical protein